MIPIIDKEELFMELTLGIVGAVTGIMGIIISVLSYSHNRIEAVNAFYSNDRDPNFIEARRIVHTLPDDYDPSDVQKNFGNQIAILILSFDQAGILIKKRQLPFWIFSRGGCGVAAVTFHKKLFPYIKYRRKSNPLYAVNFDYLVKKIISKVKLQNLFASE